MWPIPPPHSMAQFSGLVNVRYPPAYENPLAALSVVNLNLGFILSLSCVAETTLANTVDGGSSTSGGAWYPGNYISISHGTEWSLNPCDEGSKEQISFCGTVLVLLSWCTLQYPTRSFSPLSAIPWTPGLPTWALITISCAGTEPTRGI